MWNCACYSFILCGFSFLDYHKGPCIRPPKRTLDEIAIVEGTKTTTWPEYWVCNITFKLAPHLSWAKIASGISQGASIAWLFHLVSQPGPDSIPSVEQPWLFSPLPLVPGTRSYNSPSYAYCGLCSSWYLFYNARNRICWLVTRSLDSCRCHCILDDGIVLLVLCGFFLRGFFHLALIKRFPSSIIHLIS